MKFKAITEWDDVCMLPDGDADYEAKGILKRMLSDSGILECLAPADTDISKYADNHREAYGCLQLTGGSVEIDGTLYAVTELQDMSEFPFKSFILMDNDPKFHELLEMVSGYDRRWSSIKRNAWYW